MNNKKLKIYIVHIVNLLKKLGKKAKKDVDSPKKGSEDYNKGIIMGYYSIISLLKHQAFVFCIDQKELGLADITPDIDLLGLDRNSDIDFGRDNWVIEVMNEERLKRYITDFISALKEQAEEAKLEADYPKKGDADYNNGYLMTYRTTLSLLKDQALVFNIDQEAIGLSDIEPQRDVL